MSRTKNLYVCGISDRLSVRDLEDEFGRYGKVASVDLKVGFGFVEFEDEHDAEDAVKGLNGKDLEGRQLRVEYGRNRGGGGGGGGGGYRGVSRYDSGRGGASEKIYVGGLPMETTEDDIHDLFDKYGRLEEVVLRTNLPRPPAFAFITFESSRDAEDAVAGRNDYMFNGSRLRCEFSKAERGGGGYRGRSRSRSRGGGRRDSYRRRSRSRSRSRRRRSPSRSRSRRRRSPSRSRSPRRSRSRSSGRKKKDSRSRSCSRSVDSGDDDDKKKKKKKKEKKKKEKKDSKSRSRSASKEKNKSRSPSIDKDEKGKKDKSMSASKEKKKSRSRSRSRS